MIKAMLDRFKRLEEMTRAPEKIKHETMKPGEVVIDSDQAIFDLLSDQNKVIASARKLAASSSFRAAKVADQIIDGLMGRGG